MNTQKHTPGPWAAQPNPNLDNTWEAVTRDCCISSCGTGNEALANARLISAAPDMLKALQECFELLDSWGFSQETEAGKACELARAAIAKAKGEL